MAGFDFPPARCTCRPGQGACTACRAWSKHEYDWPDLASVVDPVEAARLAYVRADAEVARLRSRVLRLTQRGAAVPQMLSRALDTALARREQAKKRAKVLQQAEGACSAGRETVQLRPAKKTAPSAN